jgi:hypothetical protein
MGTNIEDYRRHFSNLSDEALLETRREDLVEAARQAFVQEMAERGLNRNDRTSEEFSVKAEAAASESEMVLIDTFASAAEAGLAEALLEASKIPCRVGDTLAAAGLPAYAAEGVPLFVPAAYQEQAELILAAQVSDEELAAQAEAAGREDE